MLYSYCIKNKYKPILFRNKQHSTLAHFWAGQSHRTKQNDQDALLGLGILLSPEACNVHRSGASAGTRVWQAFLGFMGIRRA